MKLSKLVALDYCLKSLPEIAEKQISYQLVLKDGIDIFTGDLISFGSSGVLITQFTPDKLGKITEIEINDIDEHELNSFSNLRFKVLRQLKNRYLPKLVDDPSALLPLLIDLIEDYDVSDDLIPRIFKNYSSLNNGVVLPFKLITKDDYEIISLLSHS